MTNPPDNRLTPEEELLISLCRSLQERNIPEPGCDINWDYFVSIANENGVLALSLHNLQQSGHSSRMPLLTLETMQTGYYKSLVRNAFLYDNLREIAALAATGNIDFVLLKGIALEKAVYGNRGLRQMNDIDILVRREDAIPLRKLLLANGFRSMPMMSPLHEKILPSYGKHLPEMEKGGVAAEIHFRLFDLNDLTLTGRFIDSSAAIPGEASRILFPDPLMHFLYLVKHLALHERNGNSQLRLYADLAILISAYPDRILIPELFELAGQAGISRALSEKLYILEIFWKIAIPPDPGSDITDINREKVISRFLSFLRNPSEGIPEGGPESLLSPLKDLRGIKHRLMFMAGYLFPSIEFMRYRYGSGSSAGALIYYPVRWFKMIRLLAGGRL